MKMLSAGAAAVVLLVGAAAAASLGSVPGELLYPVKRQVESARIFLAPTPQLKQELQVDFAEQRLQEFTEVWTSAERGGSPGAGEAPGDGGQAASSSGQPGQKPQSRKQEADHKEQVKREAEAALEFLSEAQERLKGQGNDAKAEHIDKTIQEFKKGLEKDKDQKPKLEGRNAEPGRAEKVRGADIQEKSRTKQ